jgi:hypothetical protein
MAEKYIVGQEYPFNQGVFVYKGGDPKDRNNWVDAESWSSTAFKAKNFITGEGRYDPSIPEIGQATPSKTTAFQDFKTAAGLLTSSSVESAKNIIKNNVPGAEFKTDNFGNTLAVIDGKPYYLNKPGMSAQDTLKTAFTIVNFLGLGKLYGIGKQGVGLLSNIGRSAATGTTLSAGEDVVAKMTGSEQKGLLGMGIDPVKAATTGALTGVFQAGGDILISAIPTIARNLKNIKGAVGGEGAIFDSTGSLTPSGQTALKNLGIEWKNMTNEFKARLRNEFSTKTPASPEEAIRYAEADSLPVAVPQTKGTLSGKPAIQLREDLARKGVYGEEAERIIRNADEEALAALGLNLSEIQKIIAGGGSVIEKGQGASQAQAILSGAREAEKKAVDAAYDAARTIAKEEGTVVPSNIFKGFGNRTKLKIQEKYALDDLPQVNTILKRINSLEKKKDGVVVKDLFDLRQQINSRIIGNPGTEIAGALGIAKTQLDNQIDDLVLAVLKEGDTKVVAAWRDAIKGYKDYAQKWKSKDLLDKITQKKSGTDELVIAPEDAGRFIFNRTNLGFLTKQNLQRDLVKLKKELPPDQWNELRQEIYLKIVGHGKQSSGNISGAKLLTSINKSFEENKPLMNMLFNQEERNLLKQFARVANATTSTTKQTSNTAVAQSQMLKDMWLRIVPLLGVKDASKWLLVAPGLKGIAGRFRSIQAEKTIGATPSPAVSGPLPSVIGLESGEIYKEAQKPSIIQQ